MHYWTRCVGVNLCAQKVILQFQHSFEMVIQVRGGNWRICKPRDRGAGLRHHAPQRPLPTSSIPLISLTMLGSPLSRRDSSPSTNEKISSPRPSSPPPAGQAQSSIRHPSSRDRPLVELIGAQFPAFDCDTAVVFPFQDEAARDEGFQKGKLIFRCAISGVVSEISHLCGAHV